MAKRRRDARPGVSAEDRDQALGRARTFCWYGLAVEVDPPWAREQVEAMDPVELRDVMAARPELPTASTVAESLEVVEGLRLASVFWERRGEVVSN